MINVLPSGSLILDRLMGIGGYPQGYITEICGPAQSTKTSIALSFIRENQGHCISALVDAEHKFDAAYAAGMGISVNNLIIFQGNSMKDVIEFVNTMFEQNVDIVILDSIASVNTTRRELWCLLSKLSDQIPANTCVMWLNQVRARIAYEKNVSYGGKSVRFYPAIRMTLDHPTAISSGRMKLGIMVKCLITKNIFLTPPQSPQEIEIFYGKGTWKALDVIDMGMAAGILERRGTWYYYRDRCLGEGRYASARNIESLPMYPSLIEMLRKGVRS